MSPNVQPPALNTLLYSASRAILSAFLDFAILEALLGFSIEKIGEADLSNQSPHIPKQFSRLYLSDSDV